MKRKALSSNSPVTKAFFRKGLTATKNDLRKELTATKDDLRKEIEDVENSLRGEMDRLENRIKLMFDRFEGNIDEKNKKYRDEFLIAIDPILKEVLASREERTITAHQIAELRDRVDEHEDRIKLIEQSH